MGAHLNKSLEGIGMTSSRVREKMVEIIESEGVSNVEVLEAMGAVPRHVFVDSAISHRSYENISLPIGWEQTISQPLTVARITEIVLDALIKLKMSRHKILEIGGGCGYQAAILAQLFKEVYSAERVSSLYTRAIANINKLGQNNIHFSYRDGYEGWSDEAPFDAIIVSAAATNIPQTLVKQLGANGCLVVPIGNETKQRLTLVLVEDGKTSVKELDEVVFVPLLKGLVDGTSHD